MNASREDRVLVVDEPDGRELLELGLEMAGYQWMWPMMVKPA